MSQGRLWKSPPAMHDSIYTLLLLLLASVVPTDRSVQISTISMSRYDGRAGPTRLYVGHISSRTRSRDLEDLFSKYGRVREVDMKQDFAFVNFSDSRGADEAQYFLNGRTFDGSRIVVEFAKRGPQRGGGAFSRDFVSRGPPPGTGRCYNCGHDGHWARDCKAGDWKNRCYRCGERGHIERSCRSSPRRNRSRPRSRSRSPVQHRSRSRSYEHGRSGSPRNDQRNTEQGRQPQQHMKASRSRSRTPQRSDGQSRSVSPVVKSQSPSRSCSASGSPSHCEDDLEKSPVKEYQSSSHSGAD